MRARDSPRFACRGVAHDLDVGMDVRMALEVDHRAGAFHAPDLPVGVAAALALGRVERGPAPHVRIEAVARVGADVQRRDAAIVLDRGQGVLPARLGIGGEHGVEQLAGGLARGVRGLGQREAREAAARALRLEHQLVRRLGDDRGAALPGAERGEEAVEGVAVVREGVARDAPLAVADLVAVRDAAAERGAGRGAAAQQHVAARDHGLSARLRRLAVDRERAPLEPALHGDRALEGLAPVLAQHRVVEIAGEPQLGGREQRCEMRAAQHRERVVDLPRRVVGREHEVRALAGGERGAERAERLLERGGLARAEAARRQPAGARADPDEKAAPIEPHGREASSALAGSRRRAPSPAAGDRSLRRRITRFLRRSRDRSPAASWPASA